MTLPEGQKLTLLAANSLPKTTYAAINISSSTPPSMTRAQLAAVTSANIEEFRGEIQRNLQKVLPAQGNQLLEILSVRLDKLGGLPAIITEYRRTGPQGPVWVQLTQVMTARQELAINLSYRESFEAAIWKSVIETMRN